MGELVPVGEGPIMVAIGQLRGEMISLRREFAEFREDVIDEQRKVHDIVTATNEAMRNNTKDILEMAPIVKDYELTKQDITKAVDLAFDYREKRAEGRGMNRVLGWLIGLLSMLGGGIAYVVGATLEKLLGKH